MTSLHNCDEDPAYPFLFVAVSCALPFVYLRKNLNENIDDEEEVLQKKKFEEDGKVSVSTKTK